MLKLLEDRDSKVRDQTIRSLSNIKDKRVVEPIIERFKFDEEEPVRHQALFALINLPATVEQILEVMIPTLNDKEPYIRRNAIYALRNINNEQVIELLIKALEDEDTEVRQEARFVLGKIANKTGSERVKAIVDFDANNLGIKEGAALYKIRREFARNFRHWEITLPDENVEKRMGGFIAKAGWGIKFIFGAKDGSEYLEYCCAHRMLGGEPQIRIYESGVVEQLDESVAVLKEKGLYMHEESEVTPFVGEVEKD